MPERMLRPGILTSEAVNHLSFAAEVFYRRLMSVVDDYGRFDGRASILRANLYPLKLGSVVEPDVEKWLAECAGAGLVRVYEVEKKRYVMIEKFDQRLRAKKSKWPEPADKCPQVSASCGQARTFATETETETNSETNSLSRARAKSPLESKPLAVSQQAAEIAQTVELLRGFYGVTDAAGVQLNDQINTLAIELHGAGISRETIQGFWAYRKVKPQVWPAKRFVGDCLAWRVSSGSSSTANAAALVGAPNGSTASKNWTPPPEPESFREFRAAIRGMVEPSAYSTWFAPIRFTDLDDQSLIVRVPDAVFGDWISNNYRDVVQAALQAAGLANVADLRFVGDE